tara:strand:- start:24 stop:392 length:369 start_codon:yes stop_codon:yes gene_type:complete
VIKKFDNYELYKSWWEADGEVAPTLESLPRLGMMYDDIGACFLADTDTDFCIITWWYTNPDKTAREKYKALDEMFNACIYLGEMIGKKKIFCYNNMRAIIKLLESKGFINYEGHLVKELSNG